VGVPVNEEHSSPQISLLNGRFHEELEFSVKSKAPLFRSGTKPGYSQPEEKEHIGSEQPAPSAGRPSPSVHLHASIQGKFSGCFHIAGPLPASLGSGKTTQVNSAEVENSPRIPIRKGLCVGGATAK